jgi:hypothetical protein
MKRTIIIVGVIIVVLIVIIVLFFLRGSGSSGGAPNPVGTGTLPTPPIGSSSSTNPTGSTFTIGTSEGTVTVNNFYKNAAFVSSDGQAVALTQNPQYTIVYNTSDSGFIISLLSEPLATARADAESGFLQELGISQGDACKLNVDEGVPIDVTSEYAGENLGLSFCPGAASL